MFDIAFREEKEKGKGKGSARFEAKAAEREGGSIFFWGVADPTVLDCGTAFAIYSRPECR